VIVVADSSPLNYLILIEQTVVLHRLYGSVLVPEPVAVELRAARAPQPVREFTRTEALDLTEPADELVPTGARSTNLRSRTQAEVGEPSRAILTYSPTDGALAGGVSPTAWAIFS
jgi:predicted nucleic acid-binding protein